MAENTNSQHHTGKNVVSSMQESGSQAMCPSSDADTGGQGAAGKDAATPTSGQEHYRLEDIASQVIRVNYTRRYVCIAGLSCLVGIAIGAVSNGLLTQSTAHEKGSKENPVVIGVIGANDPHWRIFASEAQKQGIYVDLKNFSDYTSENPALAQKNLDLNEFQHILYLANYNIKNNEDLQPIGGVAVYPLCLFSSQYTQVSDIPAGSCVVIPNDETNQARALGVLDGAHLITLKQPWTAFSTPKDIDEAASRVRVLPVEAAKVANSLSDPSVAAAVVNNDYMKDAGLDPNSAIFKDDATSEYAKPYINIWTARKEDINNPVYLKLVDIWHEQAVSDALLDHFQHMATLNNDSGEVLRDVLKQVQEQQLSVLNK